MGQLAALWVQISSGDICAQHGRCILRFPQCRDPIPGPLGAMAAALENSSFLVQQPESRRILATGAGFVALLSNSTGGISPYVADHDVWGKSFLQQSKGLTLAFRPAIPAYLIGKDKMIAATFLGRTQVEYHFDAIRIIFPAHTA